MAIDTTMIAARTEIIAVTTSLEETGLDLEVFGRIIEDTFAGTEVKSEGGSGGGGGGGGEGSVGKKGLLLSSGGGGV